ncbi:MAG: hypothetical protein MZV64_06540 [Ignavibacteriales bacterium]|nr:hypothetical protein [Ignavibacteriales bacterium]
MEREVPVSGMQLRGDDIIEYKGPTSRHGDGGPEVATSRNAFRESFG